MSVLTSKTRAQGASLVTTLPAEVARRLTIEAGQELLWIEDGMGGFRIMLHSAETAEELNQLSSTMAEFDSVFRALASAPSTGPASA